MKVEEHSSKSYRYSIKSSSNTSKTRAFHLIFKLFLLSKITNITHKQKFRQKSTLKCILFSKGLRTQQHKKAMHQNRLTSKKAMQNSAPKHAPKTIDQQENHPNTILKPYYPKHLNQQHFTPLAHIKCVLRSSYRGLGGGGFGTPVVS